LYAAFGLSVIPVRADGSKASVGSWKEFQSRIATDCEIESMFRGECGLAIVCGSVSGNLEVLDFDSPEHFEFWRELAEEIAPELLERLVTVQSPSGGKHLYYRCDKAEGNQKLAQAREQGEGGKPKLETLIETRGEGGYIIAPPSPAACHPDNKPYLLLNGDFTDVPQITSAERDILLDCARSFNQDFAEVEPPGVGTSVVGSNRPGDEFNASFGLPEWGDLLSRHGWKKKAKHGGVEYWQRDGKNGKGISATLNFKGGNVLYVFSSNAYPFRANTAYNPFAAYAFLEHGGDFSTAAKALIAQGYGEVAFNDVDARREARSAAPKASVIKKDELVRLAEGIELFCEPDGGSDKAFATVPVGSHFETYPINGKEFRLWLTNEFYKAHGEAVSQQPMQDALTTLAAKAYFAESKHRVFIRVAELGGKVYYDLGDEAWRVVEIDAGGWRILDKSPVKFIRPSSFKAQVTPVRGGGLDELRRFINVSSADDWVLFLGWLISSYRPNGPYALLSLAGTQDAAKSTTTKMIRLLIDPSTALVRAQPKEERDLMVGAKNNWLLAFDNLSFLPDWLSDALCRVSTGGGQANRELYKNGDEHVFDVMRPVVMNGIEELATRPDLADRTINVFLPSLRDEQRKDEKVLYAEYGEALPRILGAIFDALSVAIRNFPQTHLDRLPRMADVARFVTAAEAGFGWKQGRFVEAYEDYRRTARINALEASNVGTALLTLMEQRPTWEGTASELMTELDGHLPAAANRRNFPSSARAMSSQLRRIMPNLREAGIEVEMPEGTRRVAGGKVARVLTITNKEYVGAGGEEPLPF
jgi:hypothetical protein